MSSQHCFNCLVRLVWGDRAGEDDMPLEEAVKDEERQKYYKGYLESMVTAVSRLPLLRVLFGKGGWMFVFGCSKVVCRCQWLWARVKKGKQKAAAPGSYDHTQFC